MNPTKPGAVVALAGGVGGARLVDGLDRALPPGVLVVVANTGDDFEHWGLHISPDLDTKVAKRLQSVLIGLQESLHGRRLLAAAGLTALVPANDSEYDIHREIVLRVLGERF